MTSIPANAFASDGHFLFPQRSKLDGLPIVKRKDEAKWGTYRTQETILRIYDALAKAQRTGQPYATRLNSPPADPKCCCHPGQSRQGENRACKSRGFG